MAITTLRPNATISNSGTTVTGAATLHAATSDDSDSTWITFSNAVATATLRFGDLSLPAGDKIKRLTLRVRRGLIVAGQGRVSAAVRPETGGAPPYLINPLSIAQSGMAPITFTYGNSDGTTGWPGTLTDANIDAAYVVIGGDGSAVTPGGNACRVYEIYLDVMHVPPPVVTVTAPSGTVTDTNLPIVTWEMT